MSTHPDSSTDPLPSLNIAILYSDAKREYFQTEEHYVTEAEVFHRAQTIAKQLEKDGHHCYLFAGNQDLAGNLKECKPDMALNLVDSVYGKEFLSGSIPGLLEILQIPYTGSGILGQSINSNKYLTKSLMQQYGVTTPKFQLITSANDEIDNVLDYPLIAKLNEVHGSLEISKDSICFDEKSLKQVLKRLFATYNQPVLVEEFIAGKEITAIVAEGGVMKIYAGERHFLKRSASPFEQIAAYDDVWSDEDTVAYEKYELPVTVKEMIKLTYGILRLEDYARFDMRLDQSGRHYIIDANSNPALGLKNDTAIGTVLDLYGVSFSTFMERLLRNTMFPNP